MKHITQLMYLFFQVHLLTKDELAYLVKIVKHTHASAVMGNAKMAFDTFES